MKTKKYTLVMLSRDEKTISSGIKELTSAIVKDVMKEKNPKPLKIKSIEQLEIKYFGKTGSKTMEAYQDQVNIEIISEMLKQHLYGS